MAESWLDSPNPEIRAYPGCLRRYETMGGQQANPNVLMTSSGSSFDLILSEMCLQCIRSTYSYYVLTQVLRKCLQSPGLAANSILFCSLFTITDWCAKVRFQQTHNQGLHQLLLTVSWDLRV